MADLLAADFQSLNLDIAQYDGDQSQAAAADSLAPTEAELQMAQAALNGVSDEGELDKDNDILGKIFVGGISWQTSDESLSKYFSKFGALADVALMKDKYTGQPRGFGFIKFEDPAVVDVVLTQAEHSIDGRTVDVKRAVPKSEAPGPSRTARPADTNKVFVGGLAPSVTVAEFRTYFEGFGAVSDAVVMFDRQTLRSRGFGFVTFQEDSVVQNVLMGTHEINGKMVEVKHAEPKESRRGGASPGAVRAANAYGAIYGMPGGGRGRNAYAARSGGGAVSPYAGYGVYGASAAAAAAAYGTAYGAAAAAAYGSYPAYTAYSGSYANGGYGAANAAAAAAYAQGAYRGSPGGYDAAAAGGSVGSPYVSVQQGVNGYGLGASSASDAYAAEYASAFRAQAGAATASAQARTAAEPAYVAQQY